MLEKKFIRLIIMEILETADYNITGIALYTDTVREIIEEVFIGRNTNPPAIFLRKLIELHRSVRSDLYQSIIKKIMERFKKSV